MEKDFNFENIYLSFVENEDTFEKNIDIDELMNEINSKNIIFNNNLNSYTDSKVNDLYPQYYHYDINYTIQQLLVICDYYNIIKTNKLKKENKINIIHKLVEFENDEKNYNIVIQRKKYWFYMNELKNDKIMKKYILW
jgi:hypothetical protein